MVFQYSKQTTWCGIYSCHLNLCLFYHLQNGKYFWITSEKTKTHRYHLVSLTDWFLVDLFQILFWPQVPSSISRLHFLGHACYRRWRFTCLSRGRSLDRDVEKSTLPSSSSGFPLLVYSCVVLASDYRFSVRSPRFYSHVCPLPNYDCSTWKTFLLGIPNTSSHS